MALFIDVARGNDAIVADRRTWLEPFWPAENFSEYIARGLLAEHALWHGDTATALAEVAACIKVGTRLPRRLRAAADPGGRGGAGRPGRPGRPGQGRG